MPRTRSIVWSQLRLGILSIVTVVAISAMVVAVGGQGGCFWQRYPLKARFEAVQGLKPGAVTRLNGKDVGRVKSVEFSGAEIEVVLELSKDVRPLITTDSVASIGSLGLLGDPIMNVTASQTGQPLPDWGVIQNPTTGGQGLSQSAEAGLNTATEIMAGIKAGRGSLGKLVTDEALYNEMRSAARQLNSLLVDIRKDPKKFLTMRVSVF